MPFPASIQSTFKSIWKTGLFLAAIVSPLILDNSPAQADDFYQHPHWNRQNSSTGPQVIFTLPSQHRSTQSTTIFQNGQVIRIHENSNAYRNPEYFFPFGNRRSVEFSIGNQGEFRQIERYPLNTWNQPQWRQPQWRQPQWHQREQSTFRSGLPSRHHRRW